VPFKHKLILNIGLIWQKEATLHKGALAFINFLSKIWEI